MERNVNATTTPVIPIALLPQIISSLPQPLALVDADGRVVYSNEAWERSRLRQLVGTEANLLPPKGCIDDANSPLRMLEGKLRSVLDGGIKACQTELTLPNGVQQAHVLLRITAFEGAPGHAMLTQEDVTNLVASKRSVAESDRLLRMVMRSLPVGVTVFTGDGQVVMSNPAAKSLAGGFRLGTVGVRMLDRDGQAIAESDMPVARALASGTPVLDQFIQVELPGRSNRVVSYSALPILNGPGRGRGAVAVQLDITERTHAEQLVLDSEHRMHAMLASVSDGIIGLDANDVVVFCNPAAEAMLPTSGGAIGRRLVELVADDAAKVLANSGQLHELNLARDGVGPVVAEVMLTPTTGANNAVVNVLTIRDITQQRNMQAQLSHAQKLEGIGQLAAGIAHEINTPTQYIGDNIRFLNDSLQPIAAALDELHKATKDATGNTASLARATELMRAVDWDFLRTEIPRAFTDSLDGIERVARIVTSMKEFSHPDSTEKQTVDVNRVVTSAVNVCRHEWREVAEVSLELDPALPGIPGFAGDLGQVVLNLVINAAHAIVERGGLGHIEVKTSVSDGGVVVAVADDGPGIPDQVKPRIFEQFFTTKAVGKGTGQGLSLVHRIVVNRHGGRVWFESFVGKGTTFFIQLPT